ncbi:type II secretion system protein GspK [Pseudoteredinibacter isoporae]|uniref:General secretion pathway protein K n=1 Tax=Pseudoteredinibacter isoporae TaxID=570281 RepID=A0A7X0JSG2_9GAMM|nr:type II secretion system protein GspK [Pseudoteredinibacter isoporae]MBB6521009.1 general secretion pathway protein K [Pseudoteredinibacter isoporae]NHO86574.1 hypothetical protein [Pseudoteredinibacter isoporae]NIB24974.1 hypothetical protein [Pseudoteredinibacter isoporae]
MGYSVSQFSKASHKKANQGLALVMVMWLVAAMSLLVAGVLYSARMDVKQVQLQSKFSKHEALADGAAKLLLRDYNFALGEQLEMRGPYLWQGELLGVAAKGRMVSVKGLIDLNSVGLDAMAQLLSVRLEMEPEQALELAQNLIDWRRPVSGEFTGMHAEYEALGLPVPRHDRLLSVADLLAVNGFNFEMLQALNDVVYVERSISGGVDPASAPIEVLSVLANGNEEVALNYETMRREAEDSSELLNHAEFNADFFGQNASTLMRLDIELRVEQEIMTRRLWVDTAGFSNAVPWEVVRVEPMQISQFSNPSGSR